MNEPPQDGDDPLPAVIVADPDLRAAVGEIQLPDRATASATAEPDPRRGR